MPPLPFSASGWINLCPQILASEPAPWNVVGGGGVETSLIMKEWVSHVSVMMSGFDSLDPCGLTEMIFGD